MPRAGKKKILRKIKLIILDLSEGHFQEVTVLRVFPPALKTEYFPMFSSDTLLTFFHEHINQDNVCFFFLAITILKIMKMSAFEMVPMTYLKAKGDPSSSQIYFFNLHILWNYQMPRLGY